MMGSKAPACGTCEAAYHWSGFDTHGHSTTDLVKNPGGASARSAGTLLANWTYHASRCVAMGQKRPFSKQRKPILTHALIDLLRILQELEDLREQVRAAEAERVLH